MHKTVELSFEVRPVTVSSWPIAPVPWMFNKADVGVFNDSFRARWMNAYCRPSCAVHRKAPSDIRTSVAHPKADVQSVSQVSGLPAVKPDWLWRVLLLSHAMIDQGILPTTRYGLSIMKKNTTLLMALLLTACGGGRNDLMSPVPADPTSPASPCSIQPRATRLLKLPH